MGVLALLLCNGCSGSPSQPSPFRLGESFELRLGARAELDGDSFLLFDDVPSDSRCAIDVQCVRAGEAVVSVRFGVRNGPTAPTLRAIITVNGVVVDANGPIPLPFCTPEPGTVECRLTTSEGQSAVKTGAHTIRLVQLTPTPRAGASIARSDYVGTFVVTR